MCVCTCTPYKYRYLFDKTNKYTYRSSAEELALLDFVFLWRSFITKMKGDVNCTSKPKQSSV